MTKLGDFGIWNTRNVFSFRRVMQGKSTHSLSRKMVPSLRQGTSTESDTFGISGAARV